jgi:hypothetical protein
MFAALLDTSVLWPSLQRNFLLSLAIEGLYRPLWSSEILAELEYHEARKLINRGEQPDAAAVRTRHLIDQMTTAFDDSLVENWEPHGDIARDHDPRTVFKPAQCLVGDRLLTDSRDRWAPAAPSMPATWLNSVATGPGASSVQVTAVADNSVCSDSAKVLANAFDAA